MALTDGLVTVEYADAPAGFPIPQPKTCSECGNWLMGFEARGEVCNECLTKRSSIALTMPQALTLTVGSRFKLTYTGSTIYTIEHIDGAAGEYSYSYGTHLERGDIANLVLVAQQGQLVPVRRKACKVR